ncbi:sensor histidine kinase [Sporosarcina sp. FSL K6-3457]|uniref:sensor histidine kinase n=1 Tax=Sporosarcina sp. FSL K6-3457 TaxID=2978204 RepID=UPI0030F6E235
MNISFTHFLRFQRRTIAMYLFIMTFITIMLYVEPTMSIHLQNIIYIHLITFSIFSFYMAIEFFNIKKSFSYLEQQWKDGQRIHENVNPSKTYEQYLYSQFLQSVHNNHQEKILTILQEKKETLDFMTSWFHEIKTPIAISKLIVETNPKSPDLISIDDEISTIDDYVEQALYFVRTDDFNHDYFISQTALDHIVRSVIKQQAKLFIKKNIKVDFQVESTDILTDKKWFEYVLSQILSNSLKYTEDGGTIRLLSEEDSKEVRLIISDNGIGISPSDLSRIFDKGFTGTSGRIHKKSTGIGLYLAQKLANKLGHTLSVTSKENDYTTFTIHFPKGLDYYSIL